MPCSRSVLQSVTLQPRHPAVSLDDLALMLEIDLTVLGDKTGFRRRLKRALENAFQQGQCKQPIAKTRN